MLGLGVMLMVIAHQVWLQARGWRFNALSPYFLVDFLIFTLIGLGSLVEPLPHRSLTEETLFSIFVLSGLGGYYLGLHFPFRTASKRWLRYLPIPFSTPQFLTNLGVQAILFACAMMIFCGLIILRQISLLGLSLREMLSIGSTTIYARTVAEGHGSLLVTIIYLITVMVLIVIYRLLRANRYLGAFCLYATLSVCYLSFASTRIPIFLCLSVPIAYYHYAIKRIDKLLIIALLIGAPVIITLLNAYRQLRIFTLSYNVIELAILESSGVMMSLYTLWQNYIDRNLELEWGANYYYYSLLTLVPRDIWAEKPQTSFETRWTVNLYGSLFMDGSISVRTFTPWGEGLVQFGWLGGFVNLFLYGLILKFATQFFNNRPHACLVYYFYAVLAATFVRTSVQALAFTTLLYLVAVWLYEAIFMKRPSSEEVIARCAS